MIFFRKKTVLLLAVLLFAAACSTTVIGNLTEIPFAPYDKIQGAPVLHTFGLSFNEIAGGSDIIGKKGNDAFKSREITVLNHFKRAMEGTMTGMVNARSVVVFW